VHGYWFWDWSDQRQRVKAIYAENGTLEIAPPYHNYGYRKGQWFYGFNLLCELDQPGEWYLDREKGRLYFWPPSPLPTGRAVVSVLPTLVTFDEVSCVTFRGLIFEAARETAIIMRGGTGNRILGCTLRNLGGSAISIYGGSNHGVVGCDISQCGAGGVSLDGGDRKTLTAAGHFADNNHIHHYGRWRPMYSAGVSLNGVGNRATHNLIDNAPHHAIAFGGNDHRIEFNEIHSVCHESNDAGAIYAGRDWTMRGTVIRHNHLHDITGFEGRGCVGVYLGQPDGRRSGIRGRGPCQLRAQARGPRAQVGLRAAPIGEDRALRRSEPRLLAREAHRAPGECGGTCAVNRSPLSPAGSAQVCRSGGP